MLRKSIILLIIAVCSSFVSVSAKSLSNSQKRTMNLKVLDMIEQYEIRSILYAKNAKYGFMKLFTEDASIFCDMYNHPSFKNHLKPAEYVDYMLKNCQNINVSLANVKKEEITYSGGKWNYKVVLDKQLSFNDVNGILFPFDDSDILPFKLEFTFEFSNDFKSCRISEIRGLNISEFPDLKNFYIIQENTDPKQMKRDKQILVNGKNLKFNSFHQSYAPELNYYYWDDNIRLSKKTLISTDLYDHVQFQYSPRHFRLLLRNEFAPFMYNVKTDIPNFMKKSWGYDVGLDLGCSFSLSRNFLLELYLGVAYSMSELNMTISDLQYNYKMTDQANKIYARCYDISSVSQGLSFKDIMVPFYLKFNFKLNDKHYLYLDLGAKTYFNMNTLPTAFHMTGNVYAEYPDGNVVTEGGDALGGFDNDYNEFLSPAAFKRNPIDLSLMANLGYSMDLYKRILFLDIKVGYEHGILNSYTSDENSFFNPEEGIYPLVYSGTLKKDVVFRPLADCISFKRQAFWIDLGLTFKF